MQHIGQPAGLRVQTSLIVVALLFRPCRRSMVKHREHCVSHHYLGLSRCECRRRKQSARSLSPWSEELNASIHRREEAGQSRVLTGSNDLSASRPELMRPSSEWRPAGDWSIDVCRLGRIDRPAGLFTCRQSDSHSAKCIEHRLHRELLRQAWRTGRLVSRSIRPYPRHRPTAGEHRDPGATRLASRSRTPTTLAGCQTIAPYRRRCLRKGMGSPLVACLEDTDLEISRPQLICANMVGSNCAADQS